MKQKKLDFKTADVLEEICKAANLISEEITDNFSRDFYCIALDLDADNNVNADTCIAQPFTYKHIEYSPIAFNIMLAHEYAQGRIWFDRKGDYEPEFFLKKIQKFYNLIEHTVDDKNSSKFAFLLDLNLARLKLDKNEKYFSFSELALLTGVDERTVRNAASSVNDLDDSENGTDKYGLVGNNRLQKFGRLKTQKIGATLLVEKKEAERWLLSRGFQFTKRIEESSFFHRPKKEIEQISTKSKFCQFVINEVLYSTDEDMDFPKYINFLSALEKEIDPNWSIRQIIELSSALQIDWKDLFHGYMKFFYPEKIFDSDKLFQKDASVIKNQIADLIYFKKILKIRDIC